MFWNTFGVQKSIFSTQELKESYSRLHRTLKSFHFNQQGGSLIDDELLKTH